jgi:hypothetical protein
VYIGDMYSKNSEGKSTVTAKKLFNIPYQKSYSELTSRQTRNKRLESTFKILNTLSHGSPSPNEEHFKGFFKDVLKKQKPLVMEFYEDISKCSGLQKLSAESTTDLMVALKMNTQDIRRTKRIFSHLGINPCPCQF